MQNDDTQEVNLDKTQDEESTEEETVDESTDEESSEEESTSEDSAELKQRLEELESEAKKWRAIAERNKKKRTETKTKSNDDDDLRSDVEQLKMTETKRQFGYEHGLSPEETDKIFSINPNPTADTLKDPFVKAGLEAVRKAKQVEQNTPTSKQRSSTVTSKSFKELSKEEKNAAWQNMLREKGVNV